MTEAHIPTHHSAASRLGLYIAPALALLTYLLFGPHFGAALDHSPRTVAAIAVLMAGWWVTEAVPLAATALLPLFLLPVLGVSGATPAAAPYADPLIFLFLGGFLLGVAFEKCGLHQRVALLAISLVGTRPAALVGGIMLAAAVMSMWVSNTATALIMLPIASSLVAMCSPPARSTAPSIDAAPAPATPLVNSAISHCMYLGIAYASSIGGMGTPIGTPPNAFAVSYLARHHAWDVGFSKWMFAAAPLMFVLLPLTWLLLTRVLHPLRDAAPLPARSFSRSRLKALGPLSPAEWTTLAIFLFAVTFWIARQPLSHLLGLVDSRPDGTLVPRLTDAAVAIAAALLLFCLPTAGRPARFVLATPDFGRVPWSVLILFGGGLSLASAMETSGLTTLIGGLFSGLRGVPLPLLLLVVAAAITLLSELASNTAVAATLIPVLASAAIAMEVDPMLLVIPATLACSFGFMLPVATPPNAIVYATGKVHARSMMRAGILLDLAGIVIVALVYGLAGDLLLWK